MRLEAFCANAVLLSGFALVGLGAEAATAADRGIPEHPKDIVFPEFQFTPPEASAYRRALRIEGEPLPREIPVYVVEDHELPLVDLRVYVRAGVYLDPPGKEGLADLAATLLRLGGTEKQSPDAFDEELEFLAAIVASAAGDTESSASFNCLAKDLARVLELFFDMLRSPRFDPARLDLRKSQILQTLARRNDDTAGIESREWRNLLRGRGSFLADRTTKRSIEGISREDLIAFHRAYYHPGNFVIAVSGDVRTEEILEALKGKLRSWPSDPGARAIAPDPQGPDHAIVPGVYVVDKPDVNQGRVSIGHLSATRDVPEHHALLVLNHVLGGGGFTSRIMGRVRSDLGLAYTAASRFDLGVYFPGDFRVYFQSKSASVVDAIGVALEEIRRMRESDVSAEELATAISYGIDAFPRVFSDARRIAETFAMDELTRRDPSFWKTYRDKLRAVTAADVRRAAVRYLQPERLVVLIVGNASAILAGDAGRKLEGWLGERGKVRRIPLPDPLSLEVPD